MTLKDYEIMNKHLERVEDTKEKVRYLNRILEKEKLLSPGIREAVYDSFGHIFLDFSNEVKDEKNEAIDAWEELGKPEKATRALERAVEEWEISSNKYFSLFAAKASKRSGQLERARTNYERFAEFQVYGTAQDFLEDQVVAYDLASDALEMAGRTEKVKELWVRVAERWTNRITRCSNREESKEYAECAAYAWKKAGDPKEIQEIIMAELKKRGAVRNRIGQWCIPRGN